MKKKVYHYTTTEINIVKSVVVKLNMFDPKAKTERTAKKLYK